MQEELTEFQKTLCVFIDILTKIILVAVFITYILS